MTVSQKTLDALKGIGLNLYERKLYAALLGRGTSSAGELSEMAGVPRSRSYDVLQSLADKGFVVVQNAKPLKYVAVAPHEALIRSANKLKSDVETQLTRIEEMKSSPALDELKSLHSKGVDLVDTAELSGSLKGRPALHQQIDTMLKNASKHVDIVTTEDGLKEIYQNHAGNLQQASDKGVKIRIAAPLTTKNKEAAEALKEVASVKHLNKDVPQGRMVVADSKEALLALTDDKQTHASQDTAFWTASDHFGQHFAKKTFDLIWENLD